MFNGGELERYFIARILIRAAVIMIVSGLAGYFVGKLL